MTWYLDGVNLDTLAYNVKNRSAGWTVPNKVGENVKVPGRHGSYWTPNKVFDEGSITLNMWAAGCEPDGSLPITEDGRRKVRENLDKLTALFSNSRRLLNLRQITGLDTPMVNEVSNPTMIGTGGTENVLVTNSFKNSYRANTTNVEVSRNISANPFLRGRDTTSVNVTEDLYPDPGFHRFSDNAPSNAMTGYYYPISQDTVTTNQAFTPINGFSMRTGQAGGRGLISISKATNFTSDAWLGTITREAWNSRQDGTAFFIQIKLNDNAISNSVSVNVHPAISYDGSTWTNGTSTPNVTLTKDAYSWLIVPATYLPAMTGSTRNYRVRYQIRINGSSNFRAGAAFDVNRLAVQDSPVAGNPWRGALDPSLIIEGNKTPLISNRAGAKSEMGFSDFKVVTATDWEVVQTASQATTSPYSFAWYQRDKGYNNEGNLCFTVFGGTSNTFRKVLPKATTIMTDQKLWGKIWRKYPGTAVVRLTKRTGSAGAYVYTTVASVTLSSTSRTFSSDTFATNPLDTYCLEVDIPRGNSGGMVPSIIFRELHVSNALVQTLMGKGKSSASNGDAASCKYVGTTYQTPIKGFTYGVPFIAQGIPRPTTKSYKASNVNWVNEAPGAITVNGKVITETANIPAYATRLTIHARGLMFLLPHLRAEYDMASSGSVKTIVTLMNSAGADLRTVENTFTYTGDVETKVINVTLAAGETKVKMEVQYYDAANSLTSFLLSQYHVMCDLPEGYTLITGSATTTSAAWKGNVAWTGTPYFSETSMSVPLPSGWDVKGFRGFDTDGVGIKVNSTTLRVPTGNLSPLTGVWVGLRRGTHTSNFTVSAKPEGGSAVSLGTITSTVDSVIGQINLVATPTTYVDFTFTGTDKIIRDVFLYTNPSKFIDLPGTGWKGFSPTDMLDLGLPTHPSSLAPFFKVVRHVDGTSSFASGAVSGWSGRLLGGGYLQVATADYSSNPVKVDGGYASAAMRLNVQSDAASRVTLKIEGATDAEKAANTWTTLGSVIATTAGYQERKVVDAPVGTKTWIRATIAVTQGALTRRGVIAVMDGVTLTPSATLLGSNFPGYFTGVRGSDGVSKYMGHIRQAWVEVTDAIDMTSQAYGTIAEFNVNMNIPGAFWEDVYETSQSLTGTGTSGTFYMGEFLGSTAPMTDLRIEVTPASGTITSFSLADRASGNLIRYSGPAQSKIIIDTTTASIVDSKGNSLIRYVTGMGSSNIMTLTPYYPGVDEELEDGAEGKPIVDWTGNVGIKVNITGRRKYLIG